ncbi:MFS transporter [Cupriavidus sp.]|uniref:MFS transporter n=1 Tax=Cupriavidus sp. TaxID=1873897 RepID=UPI0025C1D88F|nr:MFS transporter [Cupriavidus sp.]MCA3188810.1 MFS transporter [Cupriavidus sp.]MCA3198530.1 MFS transporter [Cupriavidus sp.]MCA3201276.1 MFS transporter [Cupriavidus sp.]MCA3208442.1 MFS transporter [Cupriavidus sp.]MCA3232968.1 MFS transporter [Cupriavidus sp.]
MQSQQGLPRPQRTWAILTVFCGLVMAVLDGSIANIALPSIARDLHSDPARTIWVVNAYQLSVTVFLLPLSSLGEILGYKRVYRAGLATFLIGSLLCALSPNLPVLVAARVIQGIGGAGIMSVNTALVRCIYPPTRLGRGIGLNALVVGVTIAVGPSLGALILAVGSWPWLFAVNVPVAIFSLAISRSALPETPPQPRSFDYPSAVLSAVVIALFVLGVDGLGHDTLRLAGVAGLALAILLGWLLVRRQHGQSAPLVPVDLFASRAFTLAVATSFCSFMTQMLAFVSLPFFLEYQLGRSLAETGLLITPWPLMVAVMAALSGRLSDRYPASVLAGAGLIMLAAGLIGLAVLNRDAGSLDIAWRTALCGIGFGFFQSPNNRAMISATPHERSGGASGAQATTRLLGQTTGTAVVALLFSLDRGDAARTALYVAATVATIGAIVSLSRLRDRQA